MSLTVVFERPHRTVATVTQLRWRKLVEGECVAGLADVSKRAEFVMEVSSPYIATGMSRSVMGLKDTGLNGGHLIGQ